ncbi:hypothetical protein TMatcc_002550 [Talaromyces marneffei ATCC 18224]
MQPIVNTGYALCNSYEPCGNGGLSTAASTGIQQTKAISFGRRAYLGTLTILSIHLPSVREK